MAEAENWQPLADTLGFRSEAEMLKELYCTQGFSLMQLKSILGYSVWAIRRRLIIHGVPMRGKGGPNNRIGRRRLKHLTDEELKGRPAVRVAEERGVHLSTVYAEIRLRKEMRGHEICADHADTSV
jgi:hypothetical protein